MSTASVRCRAEIGLDAPEVLVEVDISGGLSQFNIVGLPETAVRESRDRVRSAINSSGFRFPGNNRITANLSPADLPKYGGRYDLAIAMGVLVATGQVDKQCVADVVFLGELGLEGHIRPVRRTLAAAIACAQADQTLCIASGDVAEASLAKDLRLVESDFLQTLTARLMSSEPVPVVNASPASAAFDTAADLADVRGQSFARRALEIAAAGALNLLMIGPPGSGKTMLASRLPGILPELSEYEAIETAKVHSLGASGIDTSRWRQRPFRSPHHSASAVALVGGGSRPQPGEVSLAHNGVLFLDELTEYSRHTLDQLREPLESGGIHVVRAAHRAWYPAACQLVAAMNPCPCGWADDPSGRCGCSPDVIHRYRSKVSGPLLDRIDLHVDVPAIPAAELLDARAGGESSADVRERVVAARTFQLERYGKLARELTIEALVRELAPAALSLLRDGGTRLGLSARSQTRVLRVARTIADLREAQVIAPDDVAEALALRCLDRPVVSAA